MDFLGRRAKRIVVESLGWILLVVGVAALVLPGPGLLAIFAGMALLATQYDWAARHLDRVRQPALRLAEESVRSWRQVAVSVVCSLGLIAIGIIWGIHPNSPTWWPFSDKWWLIGGWGAGITLIISGIIALVMIGYSHRTFRRPNAKRS